MDYRLALMTGVDIPIPELKAILHQPSIKEISMIGEKVFFSGAQYLCINKYAIKQGENDLSETSNFQLFMMVMGETEQADKKANVSQVLSLLFPGYSLIFSPRSIVLNNGGENVIIDEDNFDVLQTIVKMIFCLQQQQGEDFNPANEAAKKIAEKIMRGRQIVAEQKAKENGDGSVFSQYLSILCVGLHIPLSELVNWTVFQLYDVVERNMLFINYDLDIRQRLAGGKPESSPDN